MDQSGHSCITTWWGEANEWTNKDQDKISPKQDRRSKYRHTEDKSEPSQEEKEKLLSPFVSAWYIPKNEAPEVFLRLKNTTN